jgi:transcriptional regulator with XRE-family HTH domain
MSPDELLRRYPRETLRWLRGQLGESQLAFAQHLGAATETVAAWEARKHPISPGYRERLARPLVPQLATPEGAAFLQSLGRGEA